MQKLISFVIVQAVKSRINYNALARKLMGGSRNDMSVCLLEDEYISIAYVGRKCEECGGVATLGPFNRIIIIPSENCIYWEEDDENLE
jgi:hypothetical protein